MEDLFVIVNPSSRPRPILHVLSSVCADLGARWEVGVTRGGGDAMSLARAAAKRGVPIVAVYGGDGAVMEAASGLRGSRTKLAILPGGTTNAVAVELGIPDDLAHAVRLACEAEAGVRPLDMGKVGDAHFLLRAGIGLSAEQVRKADRAFKNRFGKVAYSLALASVLRKARPAHYRAVLDGERTEWDGAGCIIDNAGGFGVPGLTHNPAVDLSDGQLDVFLSRTVPVGSALAILTDSGRDVVLMKNERQPARRIVIDADPPQPLQLDGEVWGTTPATIEVVPGVAQVIVPTESERRRSRKRRGTARLVPVV
jgi:YegS/Rv2252/BmrU family lipid kinase